jgi:hypothetical protein
VAAKEAAVEGDQGPGAGDALIRDDEDLSTTQAYIRSIERSLAEFRIKLLPTFPDRYDLLTRGHVDELSRLREEVDAYLRVVPQGEADLSIALKGVAFGSAPIGAVTGAVEAIRRGIQTLAGLLKGMEPGQVGRRQREVERVSELQLMGVAAGSVRVDLNLPASSQLSMFATDDIGGQATKLFLRVAAWAAGDEPARHLVREYGQINAALAAWQVLKAMPRRGGVIRGLVITGKLAPRPVRLDEKTRTRLGLLIREGKKRRRAAEPGTIRGLDLDAGTFLLRRRPNHPKALRCLFDPMFKEKEVLAAAGRQVIVRGVLLTDPITDAEKELLMTSLELTEDEPAPKRSRTRKKS